MPFRPIVFLAVILALGACSSSDKEIVLAPVETGEREEIASTTLEDEVYSDDLSSMDYAEPDEDVEYIEEPAPATQAGLVEEAGDRVFFGYDRYDLSPEAQELLSAQANWLMRYPSLNITIEGHADERGTREYNLALGERRANSVRNFVVALGIDASRINVISYGKERPAVPGSDDQSWAQNRRSVLVVE